MSTSMDAPSETVAYATETCTTALDIATYKSGEAIIRNGDDSVYALKLLSGTAKVLKRGDVVGTIKPGDYFGAIAAITGNRRHATVVAAGTCVVEMIPDATFRELITENPELLDRIC